MEANAYSFYYSPVVTTRLVWRWLATLTVLSSIALTFWAQLYPFNGQTTGVVAARYPTLLTPAGYAFSIWGLIFLGLGIYVVWQLLPAQRHNPLPDLVASPLTLASMATSAWVLLFTYELIGPSMLVMLLALLCLIVCYGRVHRLTRYRVAPRWVSIPFASYLGWISVASVVNITLGLRELGWQTTTNITVLLTLVLLEIVVALGLFISSTFREVVFPLVVGWALVAIWVAQRQAYPELGWIALVGAIVVSVGGIGLWLSQPRFSDEG